MLQLLPEFAQEPIKTVFSLSLGYISITSPSLNPRRYCSVFLTYMPPCLTHQSIKHPLPRGFLLLRQPTAFSGIPMLPVIIQTKTNGAFNCITLEYHSTSGARFIFAFRFLNSLTCKMIIKKFPLVISNSLSGQEYGSFCSWHRITYATTANVHKCLKLYFIDAKTSYCVLFFILLRVCPENSEGNRGDSEGLNIEYLRGCPLIECIVKFFYFSVFIY